MSDCGSEDHRPSALEWADCWPLSHHYHQAVYQSVLVTLHCQPQSTDHWLYQAPRQSITSHQSLSDIKPLLTCTNGSFHVQIDTIHSRTITDHLHASDLTWPDLWPHLTWPLTTDLTIDHWPDTTRPDHWPDLTWLLTWPDVTSPDHWPLTWPDHWPDHWPDLTTDLMWPHLTTDHWPLTWPAGLYQCHYIVRWQPIFFKFLIKHRHNQRQPASERV